VRLLDEQPGAVGHHQFAGERIGAVLPDQVFRKCEAKRRTVEQLDFMAKQTLGATQRSTCSACWPCPTPTTPTFARSGVRDHIGDPTRRPRTAPFHATTDRSGAAFDPVPCT
jgi:hypothetical protein